MRGSERPADAATRTGTKTAANVSRLTGSAMSKSALARSAGQHRVSMPYCAGSARRGGADGGRVEGRSGRTEEARIVVSFLSPHTRSHVFDDPSPVTAAVPALLSPQPPPAQSPAPSTAPATDTHVARTAAQSLVHIVLHMSHSIPHRLPVSRTPQPVHLHRL